MAIQYLHSAAMYPDRMSGGPTTNINTNTLTLDAVNEKAAVVYQAGQDITIRAVSWWMGSVAGTATDNTFDVRIETVGSDGSPTGTLWDTNTNVTHTFAGTDDNIVATTPDLTADATVSQGEWFAVVWNLTQIEATRTVGFQRYANEVILNLLNQTKGLEDIGAGWVEQNSNRTLIVGIKVPDGTYVNTDDGWLADTESTNSVSSDGAIRRAGLYFQMPFRCVVNGCKIHWDGGGDGVVRLYDSDGTTVLTSHTWDASKRVHSTLENNRRITFDDNVTLEPGTNYRLTFDATTTTVSKIQYFIVDSNAQLGAWPSGSDWYWTEHNGTSWSETNTKTPLMAIGIIGIDDGSVSIQPRRPSPLILR